MRVAILSYPNVALFELACAVELFGLPRPEFENWYQCDVVSFDVNHRPRSHGRSKYGTIDRALAGILDLAGVMWLQHRRNRARIHADPDTRPQSQSIQSRL